jgi:plasmid maintenance system antidote protein VapI
MKNDPLTRTTREVLRSFPIPLRAIARAAHVPHSTLARIVTGERGATPAVARALEGLLGRWGRQYESAARHLHTALKRRASQA